ncbi:MAG: Txe/YoeB family addiction module toxin [Synergistaceae bacterium]|nr:Txe/YoeB family addiction module toxin [Synergistaceae bacterium]
MMLDTNDTIFSQRALGEIMSWAFNDRKVLKRIQTLINDIQRNGLLDKTERLKYEGEECCRRRIDDKNRLVYTLKDGALFIVSCSGHYND